MQLGLHISDFTWPGGAPELRSTLRRVAAAAEEAGFARISVMDHFWQIGAIGPPENEMLEAYTTLGYLAAHTERVELLTLVSGVIYREPALLAKAVSTLDVLSGGRAWLGIGAAWNEEESRGLGFRFPSARERFERLEEAIQICLQLWSDEEAPYVGRHYELGRTLHAPQPISRPHPPILIGGGGERRTLRLVARYARACNLFAGPDVKRKLDVLAEHCEREGRPFEDVEKTVAYTFDVGASGERVDRIVDELGELAGLGFSVAMGRVVNASAIWPIELIGERVVPAVAGL
ncbi:MAG TPA: LLM class F420-dependent oxidoreductase [Acidimicrobiales bacterium]|nr:LLM class F420-dependent oxidoreductase [Acidimicrobiales bacterium]